MSDRPPPTGRGAAILALMKKKKEQEKAVGKEPQQSQSTREEPPKPRGRAALLLALQESRLKKVGGVPQMTVSCALPAPIPPIGDIEKLKKSMDEIQIEERESVSFRGEQGKPIRITANYIELKVEKDRGVYEYEVKFSPELDAKNQRIKLVNILMREMGSVKVFDGGNILYLPEKITDNYKLLSSTLPGVNSDKPIEVKIIYKKKKRFGDTECLHLYNVLFKRIMHVLLYTQMGRNYYDTNCRYNIPQHKLEVFPGFAVSVDELEGGLMLCLDTQHKVLRTLTAYELLTELRSIDPPRFKELATAQIVGSIILSKYNNRTYVVDDIAWDMSPLDTFETRDGSRISFVDYFKEQYNIVIKDVRQPLLINTKRIKTSGSTEKTDRMVCLIPELSYLTGLTDAMRNDFRVMKDVAQYTRVTPNQRVAALRTYLTNVNNSEDAQAILKSWGLSIAQTNVNLQGRQLPSETIVFGNNEIQASHNADWNNAVGENSVTGPVDMLNWIVFYTNKDKNNAKEFATLMVRLGGVMGCRINQPKSVQLPDDRTDTYAKICHEHIDKNVQIVVFICPSMRTDRYSVIKRICCTQLPVASQVINSRTLSNPQKLRSIVQKIALQMTCKLGGTLWTVRFPFKGWMICGIDVYHSPKGSGGSSLCGFVASMNESISRWFSMAIVQEKELSDCLKVPFTKALEMWRTENGFFPSKVVIIRDGVGDGQLDHCKRYEVEQLESVIRDFNLETKICFIVVQKRINTRLFSVNRDNFQNPPPGTIIDSDVTRKYYRDFFLVPQCVRQGTVNPTHYVILHDTCCLKADHVQRLCYKLCHLYYNWPGTIRVPAPCQYAHKLAALVGQHIKKTPSALLADKLFYL